MRHEHLRPEMGRNKPVTRHGNAGNRGRFLALLLLPFLEVDRAGERSEHHELCEGDVGFERELSCGLERVWPVGGETKDE